MPHVPIFASKAFKGKSRNGVYGDVVEELGWSTGRILEALKEAGLSEKTLVVSTNPPLLFNVRDDVSEACSASLRTPPHNTKQKERLLS